MKTSIISIFIFCAILPIIAQTTTYLNTSNPIEDSYKGKNKKTFNFPTIKERTTAAFEIQFSNSKNTFINRAFKSENLLSVLDVLQSDKIIYIDSTFGTVSMKDKESIVLYINDHKMYFSNFQLFKYLEKIKSKDVSRIEVVVINEKFSQFNTGEGEIRITKF